MKLVKVGLCKNKNTSLADKKTNNKISLNYKQYIGKFNNFEWQTAEDNYAFDLDEIYFEIELAKLPKVIFKIALKFYLFQSRIIHYLNI